MYIKHQTKEYETLCIVHTALCSRTNERLFSENRRHRRSCYKSMSVIALAHYLPSVCFGRSATTWSAVYECESEVKIFVLNVTLARLTDPIVGHSSPLSPVEAGWKNNKHFDSFDGLTSRVRAESQCRLVGRRTCCRFLKRQFAAGEITLQNNCLFKISFQFTVESKILVCFHCKKLFFIIKIKMVKKIIITFVFCFFFCKKLACQNN